MAQEYNRPRFLTLTPALVHQIRKEVLGMPKETALTCELKRLRNTRIISPCQNPRVRQVEIQNIPRPANLIFCPCIEGVAA
jgi:hypothetical protein